MADSPENGCCLCSTDASYNVTNVEAVKIRILTAGGSNFPQIKAIVETNARAFEDLMKGRVKIVIDEVDDLGSLASEIRSNAKMETALFDGFVSNPGVVGTALQLNGFMELGDFVQESSDLDWQDILLAFREVIMTYDGKIYMLPLDGDAHSMFYRRDILEHFGLQVPRTWDEYASVAKAVHGQTYKNQTLIGSCIGRVKNCVGAYWANLLLASHTQSGGTRTGHLFDPQNMAPLASEALAESIRQMEEQVKYGAPDEFEGCGGGGAASINIKHFLEGTCTLTYNWGDSYKIHLSEQSKVGGLVGVAQTPGTRKVLDRATGKLVPCDANRCKYGKKYDDIGWVNRAPYAAFGGWAAAVASNVPKVRQRVAADFFAYASSKARSSLGAIPNATGPVESFNGQDPYRAAHFDIDAWVKMGYPRQGTENYRDTVIANFDSENLATDIRFPESDKIMGTLDEKIHSYLMDAKSSTMTEANRASERLAVAQDISNEWSSIISTFDAKAMSEGETTILEQYQRSLGVFSPFQEYNYIGNVRWFGWSLAIIVVSMSFLFAMWVLKNQKVRVVKASQPFFLILVCVGTLLIGVGIFPLGIDDQIVSVRGCNIACMAGPWLFSCGFVCAFSALFSKIQRVIMLFYNHRFTKIVVKESDVIKPFVALFTVNIGLLLACTLADPLVWIRTQTSPTSSYGRCGPQEKGITQTVLLSLIAAVNISALLLANIQAFRARGISDEFSESKYIAISVASILQAVVIIVPLSIMTSDTPAIFYVILSAFAFVVAMSLLLLMFVPKILLARKQLGEKKIKQRNRANNPAAFDVPSTCTQYEQGIRIIQPQPDNSKMNEQMEKLGALKLKLVKQGVDASALFKEVGLDVPDSDKDLDAHEPKKRRRRSSYSFFMNQVSS